MGAGMKDPRRVQMGRSNKRKGSNFETRIRYLYLRYNWYVQRNTFGLYDLICLPPDGDRRRKLMDRVFMGEKVPLHFLEEIPHMIQAQTPQYMEKSKRKALIENNDQWFGHAFVITRKPVYPFELNFIPVSELKP